MQKGRKLWEKTLAWVLAVVCCLSIVNLAPVAQKASAAQPANTSAGTVHANMSEGYNYSSVQSKFEEDKENGIYYANAILYDYFNETQVAAYQNGTNKWTVSKTAFEQTDVKDSDLNWHYTGSWKIGQFETFNASLVRDYKFPGGQQSATSLIYHPLYVQAADNIVEWTQNNDWSWREAPGLQYIYSRAVSWGYLDSEPAANTNGGANLWEWRLNHGLDGQTGSGDLSHASVQGIVNSKLGPNGELLSNNDGARSNGNLVVMPQFDAEYLESAKIGTTYGSLANPLGFPFRKDTTREGYYVYNSSVDGTGYNDNAYLVNNDGNYSLSYVRSNSASDRVLDINNNPGYFPFNDKGQGFNTNGRHVINYGFGTRMDIPFKIPSNSSEDIVFHFSGDDDLWVFVDGELALDLGGAHAKSEGTINFSTGVATANQAISGAGSADVGAKTLNLSASQTSTSTQHVMTIYYMERGLYESNLMVEFNFVPISQVNGLTVSNEVIFDNINSGFLRGISATDFPFTYSIYDADETDMHLYENDTLTLPRDGAMSATSSLEQEVDGGTIRGDRMNVTQSVNNAFTTSWELKNTAGNTIYTSANSGNPYNVIDGNTGVYFRLDDNVAADAPLNLTAAFRNVAKSVKLVIDKTDTSASATDATTYRFKVLYSKVLGVNKTGSFSGEYTITDTRTGTTSPAITDSEGNITIHAYETATISGVPAYSTINVFEVDNGNYKRTNISTGTTLTNNAGYFDIEDAASYTCEVVNGDADPDVYYAEVGTPIVVNNGDELSFPTKELPLADNTPVPFTYIVHHDAGTQDVTKASGSVSLGNNWQYHDTDINLDLPAGAYFIRLKGNHAGAIILSLLQINGDGKYILDNLQEPTYWTEGTVSIRGIGPGDNEDTNGWYAAHQAVFSFGDGTNEGAVVYPITVNSNFTKLTVRAATWTDYNLEYEIFQRETTEAYDEEIQMVTDGRNYDYFEKISGIGNVSPNATVSYDDNSITYEYNGAPGVDTFYYTLERYIVGGYSYGGQTVIPDTRSISTKTVPVTVYNYQLTDNTFVVDYGLPIDTSSILSDDTLSITGAATTTNNLGVSKKANIHSGTESKYTTTDADITPGAKADVTYGRATYASNAYKYIPEKFLDAVDTFYYAEQVVANGAAAPYNAAKATPVMTAAVNIIPANVVYYEDNFSYYSDKTTTERAITYSANAPAVVDSTGLVTQSSDQNMIYGFDPAYVNQFTDSLGHALALGNGTQVQFEFKGTGFDIIARTDGSSAGVLYAVYDSSNKAVKFGMIDTYYKNGSLYQLPVISVTDLAYGQYTVKLQVMSTKTASTFYFDGIRIYNPMSIPDRSKWTVSTNVDNANAQNENVLHNAIDGNEDTRWATFDALVKPGQTFTVDMGTEAAFDTLTLISRNNDEPMGYIIYVSDNGTDWTEVLRGDDAGRQVFNLGQQNARYIKIEQTGTAGRYWSIHEVYVTNNFKNAAYVDNEENVKFQSVRQMVLGNCTMSETQFVDGNGNVVTNTFIPGSTATITGPQITENIKGSIQTVDSVVASLATAPNNEVYLGNGSSLSFKVTPVAGVAEANRTLQIEAKLVKTGSTAAANASLRINGTPVDINSSTAMYYNITVPANGEIVIDGYTGNGYNISLTNIKYAGYTFVENTDSGISSEKPYITAVSINNGAPVEFITVKSNDRLATTLTFSKEVTVSSNNLKYYVNGSQSRFTFAELGSQGDSTNVTGTNIKLEIIAPKAAGSYTIKFEYIEDGKTVSKTVNLNVAAKSTRK